MPSLANFPRRVYELKRQNRFMLIFPSDVGGSALQASVKSSSRPKWDISDVQLDYMNTKWWLAGKASWSEWSCTFYDYIGTSTPPVVENTLKELFKWYNKVYDPVTTLMKYPDQYKKDVIIQMLGPGLEGDVVETYKLFGAWPKSIDGGGLDMKSEGEVTELNVGFRYDYAIFTGPDGTPVQFS
jgi:hypothetical protein